MKGKRTAYVMARVIKKVQLLVTDVDLEQMVYDDIKADESLAPQDRYRRRLQVKKVFDFINTDPSKYDLTELIIAKLNEEK